MLFLRYLEIVEARSQSLSTELSELFCVHEIAQAVESETKNAIAKSEGWFGQGSNIDHLRIRHKINATSLS
jgi:hypothetical protein